MPEPSHWTRTIAADPQHSHRFAQRWVKMAAEGVDVDGEARLVDAMSPRRARILDAGCGTGRAAAHLIAAGHTVVGVDVDPALIDYAKADLPGGTWLVADLAELDLPAHGIAEPFDVAFCAGNVVAFLAPSTRVEVLTRLREQLADGGRLVSGHGAGRGYAFEDFFSDCASAGLRVDSTFSTWDLRPFEETSTFLVAVLSRA